MEESRREGEEGWGEGRKEGEERDKGREEREEVSERERKEGREGRSSGCNAASAEAITSYNSGSHRLSLSHRLSITYYSELRETCTTQPGFGKRCYHLTSDVIP